MKSPFETMWVSVELGTYRPCDDTYGVWPIDSLPKLDAKALDGSFGFLGKAPQSASAKKHVEKLAKAVRAKGLELPASFVTLMTRPKLYNSISSVTACEFDLGEAPIPNPVDKGAATVRFLRDQQDIFLWYLYLAPKREAQILCSRIPFDDPEVRADKDVTRAVVIGNSAIVAPDFESFIYRYWMENELWSRVTRKGATFTPTEQAYLDHYKSSPKSRRKKR